MTLKIYFITIASEKELSVDLRFDKKSRKITTKIINLKFIFPFTGDENWGGMCNTGRRQSPIDLVKEAAVAGKFTGFVFQNYDTPMKSPVIVNNGHSSE